jgi:hypothetical protein
MADFDVNGMVPAEPGWRLALLCLGADENDQDSWSIEYLPVIGWAHIVRRDFGTDKVATEAEPVVVDVATYSRGVVGWPVVDEFRYRYRLVPPGGELQIENVPKFSIDMAKKAIDEAFEREQRRA